MLCSTKVLVLGYAYVRRALPAWSSEFLRKTVTRLNGCVFCSTSIATLRRPKTGRWKTSWKISTGGEMKRMHLNVTELLQLHSFRRKASRGELDPTKSVQLAYIVLIAFDTQGQISALGVRSPLGFARGPAKHLGTKNKDFSLVPNLGCLRYCEHWPRLNNNGSIYREGHITFLMLLG